MKRIFVLLLISLFSSFFVFFIYYKQFNFIKGIELKLRDARFKLRGKIDPDKRVVIAAIDAKSINKIGRFPWDRKVFAKLLYSLKWYGAKVVSFDVIFSEKSNPDSDIQFAKAIKNSGNVILGYFFRNEKDIANDIALEELENKSAITDIEASPDVKSIPVLSMPYVEVNLPIFSKAAKSFGFFNIFADKDGIIRNATLLISYDGVIYPSLPLETIKVYKNKNITLRVEPYGIEGIYIDKRKIPCDEFGRITLNYYGPHGTFPTYSIYDIINRKIPKDKLRNKIVLVGATEIGISDIRATPVDPVLPGVEIHATVISNYLQNRFILKNGYVVFTDIAFIFGFSILLGLLLFFVRRTIQAFLLFILILVSYGFTNYYFFNVHNFNVSIIHPFLSIILTYFLSEAYRNLVEEKRSRFLKKAFSSYVSPQLVEVIVKNPEKLKLGGETREVTVLFSDIRGFTTLSESLSPEKLVDILNEYLDPMTKIVFKNKGTLDKYIGDAIMAIFNAPVEIENHEYFACKASIEMIEELKRINENFKAKNFPQIDIGIGINTGKVVAGNMGTDIRFDYTVIGDNVNLASRLEGLNKLYGTRIIVSENTYKMVKDEFKFRELDLIRVKGKKIGVKIYELNQELDTEIIEEFEKALNLYRKGKFSEAFEIFRKLWKDFNDKPSLEFMNRCKFFIESGIPSHWDGVYEAKTK